LAAEFDDGVILLYEPAGVVSTIERSLAAIQQRARLMKTRISMVPQRARTFDCVRIEELTGPLARSLLLLAMFTSRYVRPDSVLRRPRDRTRPQLWP
jgi:hypothetical protein